MPWSALAGPSPTTWSSCSSERERRTLELSEALRRSGDWTCRAHCTRSRGSNDAMAIEVETKDCTALSDAEQAEMADLCAAGPRPYEAGLLSKLAEEWVLVTLARENGRI